jgi:CBS domain-containing protein/gamma-glutamylcysteine synthetase
MGDLNVKSVQSQKERQEFIQNLLKDMQALEQMINDDWFEKDPIRIGAEQEMCLVDSNWKPYPINDKALKAIDDDDFTSELASFNLEANLKPLPFSGTSISDMHKALRASMEKAQESVDPFGANILLTGILPTIRKADVEISNITPLDRYRALMDRLKDLRGNKAFELRISGIDELNFKHDSAMLEACNTSFQVHLQVTPETFAQRYNFAQALAGPTMAICANSPLLFGRRLWKETRIALFQQSIDTRSLTEHFRDRSPRVTFGDTWLKDSILEIYRDDVARFKVLLTTEVDEDVFDKLKNGISPKLRALNIHNSTVYRWNRPCYGISGNGKPHMRIENRILPAGPTIPDAMANAALWLGLMNGMEDEIKDISKLMDFDDARTNFFAASRSGMDTQLTWINHTKISPCELMETQLLPIAKHGLEKAGIVKEDIDYYLGIIEERVKAKMTGSQWMLDSFSKIRESGLTREETVTAITAAIHNQQARKNVKPVHEWDLVQVDEMISVKLFVEEFMDTDLITVNDDDPLDLAAKIMDWRRIRHIPVEGEEGDFVGLITSRILLRYFSQKHVRQDNEPIPTVANEMIKKSIMYTVSPDDPISKAMDIIYKKKVGCLPVLKNGQLVGMITEDEYPNIIRSLMKRPAKDVL